MKKLFTLQIINFLIILFAFCIFINSSDYAQAPNWLWAKSASSSSSDDAYSVAVDASGNAYVAGVFSSSSLTIGTTTLTNTGQNDVFLAKYDSNGNVIWAKGIGGTDNDFAYSVAVDIYGNVYLAGGFSAITITIGATTLTNASSSSGSNDIFLAKYDTNGNVIWAKSAGGISHDYAYAIAMDASGNAYLAGGFNSPTIAFGSSTLTNANIYGFSEVFLVKYDSNGNVLWAKNASGSASDEAYSVAIDAFGNAYVAGWFCSATITFGSTTLTNADNSTDLFLAKYDSNGNMLWAKSAGNLYSSTMYNYIRGISVTVDVSGNAYITGLYNTSSLTFGSTTLTSGGTFLVKYNASGNVQWANSYGTYPDNAWSITIDTYGNIYVAGCFYSDTITFGSNTLTNVGDNDIFIAKFDASGNGLWAKSSGGTDDDRAYSVSLDALGNIYAAGIYRSSSIIFGSTTLTNASGDFDFFLAKSGNSSDINEFYNSSSISIFPNPSSVKITIIIPEKSTIEVLNFNGQIVKSIIQDSGESSIDIEDLSSGVYIVRVMTDKEIVTKKFIKE